MIKVVVVEDELPLLRGISNMIESIDPEFCVVKRAKNGMEALKYINKESVDLLFTDINMPMMDGLELLSILAESYPEILTVVISGFDEFSYVQKAIRYRSRNYLLKPVNRDEFEKLLSDLKTELKHNSYKEQEDYLTRLLFGNEINESVSFSGRIYPICLCAGACSAYGFADAPTINEFFGKIPIQSFLYEICGRKEGIFCYIGRNANELVILVEACSGKSVSDITKEILEKVAEELPITAAYEEKEFPLTELRKIVYALFDRMRLEGVYGETSIVNELQQRKEYTLSFTEENALLYAVKKSSVEEVRKTLEIVTAQMKKERITQKNLEQVMQRILKAMCPSKEDNSQRTEFIAEALELISDSVSLEQYFEDYFNLWEKTFFGEGVEAGKELMREVEIFITSHIEQPINTKMLSQKFGLVSPYLSKLFKDYKGETPTQYIQNIRISNAKELLVRYPDMLAKDVAEMVGYSNPLYFSKIFKKKTGAYPSEYRREGSNDRM